MTTQPALPERIGQLAREHFAEMLRSARLAVSTPGLTRHYSEAELGELVRGFIAVLGEASGADGNTEIRRAFFDTAVPALLAEGESGPSLLQSSVLFGILLARTLVRLLPSEDQEAGTVWVANFLGEYVRDLHLELVRSSG